MGAPVVLADANVLYSAILRDLLMEIAARRAIQLHWTDAIQGEWMRALLKNRPDLTAHQVKRTQSRMDAALPDACIRGYERLIDGLMMNADAKIRRIRDLNDAFRKNPFCGPNRFFVTLGITGLSDADRRVVIDKMLGFNAFTDDNDPHGEHDFGAFDHKGQKVFWKIDYYDSAQEAGSPNPSDSAVTCRVLTLMLASEY